MTATPSERLVAAVQTNCDIADARHAADLTLCTYLLQMREFHRWALGLGFGAPLDRAAIGRWIAERESRWEALEQRDFVPLPMAGHDGDAEADPFDVAAVNARLEPTGLLYGAGELEPGRPVFFLAQRHALAEREGLPVQIAGREWARGLQAPLATLGGAYRQPTIVVRRESLARWCWERFEAFSLRRPAGSPFHAVVDAYGLDRDFAAALPRWLDEQGEAAVLHEVGEFQAGLRLGPHWHGLRQALPSRRGLLHARALRDLLADLLVTLPTLIERDARASIHVWFANFDGVRALLHPSLADAYAAWCGGDAGAALQADIARGLAHFLRLAERAIERLQLDGTAAGAQVEQLLTGPEAVCRG